MGIINFVNNRIKKMDWLDIGLVKWACMFFGVLIVMLFPNILNWGINTIIIIIIILSIRPIYRYFK